MTNNKRYGEDAMNDAAIVHRMGWLRKDRVAARPAMAHTLEKALRERTA